jgi:multiple sugar transport system substrate-binding protein
VEYWKQLGKKFVESHPGTEFVVEASGVDNAYNEKLLTQISSGTVGDLIWLVNVENYQTFAGRNVLQPLNEYIERDGYETEVYLPGVLEAHRDAEGNQYIIPTGVHGGPWNLFYNKDLFDKAGVPYPSSDWTYDDLRDAAEELTRPDEGVFGYTFPTDFGESLIVLARSFGGDFLSEDGTQSLLLSDGTREAFDWLNRLVNNSKAMPRPTDIPGDGGPDYARFFSNGKLAMYSFGPWEVYVLRELIEEGRINWDMSLVPIGPAGRAGQIVTEGYAIPTRADDQDLAWEFIKLMCSREEGVARTSQGFIAPPREDALLAPEPMEDPMYATYHRELVDNPPAQAHLPRNNRVSEWFEILGTGFDRLWLGRSSVDETLENVHGQVEQLLARSPV